MRILLSSFAFYPNIGGIETVSVLLAKQWQEMGHEVCVVTQTSRDSIEDLPFEVLRQPRWNQLLEKLRWCDLYFQNNVSLKFLWPWLIVRKPLVITPQTVPPLMGREARLKRAIFKRVPCVALGRFMRDTLGLSGPIIPNPYDSATFQRDGGTQRRPATFAFLGRMVSDKAPDLVIQALAELRRRGGNYQATMIGSGPELDYLKDLAQKEGVAEWVRFTGPLKGTALASCLNEHQVMVVPSRWEEPFGIVCLEGAACGCTIVGSDRGGIPDAIGPCGMLFQSDNLESLVSALETAFSDTFTTSETEVRHHIDRHAPSEIARAYLDVFASVLERKN